MVASERVGHPYEIDYRLRAGDGNRAIVRWIGTSTDVEEQKASEEALRFIAGGLVRHTSDWTMCWAFDARDARLAHEVRSVYMNYLRARGDATSDYDAAEIVSANW